MPRIHDLHMAQRRRFVCDFDQGSFWFEYTPGRYSNKLITRYGERAKTNTERANQELLGELLTAWEFDEPVTSETIGRLYVTTSGAIITALLADLATFIDELSAAVPVQPRPIALPDAPNVHVA